MPLNVVYTSARIIGNMVSTPNTQHQPIIEVEAEPVLCELNPSPVGCDPTETESVAGARPLELDLGAVASGPMFVLLTSFADTPR